MRGTQVGSPTAAGKVLENDRESFDELISDSRIDIFSLALTLTGDHLTAREVVEEVFLRIHQELAGTPRNELERLLHRYTYDASLSRLVERIGSCVERIDHVAGMIAGVPFRAPKTIS